MGVEDGTIYYIMIKISEDRSRDILIKRRVKQGDPLSPLFFNMVIDEYLDMINADTQGNTIAEDVRVSGLGFVDDVILLAHRPTDMFRMLNQTEEFFETRGMIRNASMCASVCVDRVRDKFFIRSQSQFKVLLSNIWDTMSTLPVF